MPIKFYLYIFIIILNQLLVKLLMKIIYLKRVFFPINLQMNVQKVLFEFKYKNGKIRSRGSFKMGKEERLLGRL